LTGDTSRREEFEGENPKFVLLLLNFLHLPDLFAKLQVMTGTTLISPEDIDSLDPKEFILIKNAQVNNLKHLSVAIPRNKFVVITGLSGSGKSSLAFDTLFAEGQRMSTSKESLQPLPSNKK